MLKYKKIDPLIYPSYIMLVLCDNVNEFKETFPLIEYEFEYGIKAHTLYAYINENDLDWKCIYIIFNPNDTVMLNHGNIAHEIRHCVDFILTEFDVGINNLLLMLPSLPLRWME